MLRMMHANGSIVQVVRDPVGTFWEGVGRDGDVGNYQGAFASMAHGWSAGAAIALVSPRKSSRAYYDILISG